MKTLSATRYVTPLREGGSLPAVVEASDGRLWVAKFRGAGQGARALVAEWLAGELARACGFAVPEIVRLELDAVFGRNEPDPEIRDLLRASPGPNLGLAFLPGAVGYDPAAPPDLHADLASEIVWFDAFVTNVDRTAAQPEPAAGRGQALAHRPRRRALFSPRVEQRRGERRQRVRADSRSRAAAARIEPGRGGRAPSRQARGGAARPIARGAARRLARRSGCAGRPRRHARKLTPDWFAARLEAAPLFTAEAERARAALV